MNAKALAALIDEGLTLKEEIDAREKRLKEIDKILKAHAESRPADHVKLKDEEREGTRLLIPGSKRIVPVVFSSDLIRQSIADDSEDLTLIHSLAEGQLPRFYKRTVTWNAQHVKSSKFDGKAFRAAAREVLSDPEAFINACVRRSKEGIPMSQAKVSWDEAENAA